MKTYSVKQIAELLETNPETVRRWIRNKKLKAVQVSRKGGNVISEDDLKRFLSSTPKYLSKLSSTIGIGTFPVLTGGAILSCISSIIYEKNQLDLLVSPEELRRNIQESIQKLNCTIMQKQALIRQTEVEIEEIQRQIGQLVALLNQDRITLNRKSEVRKKKGD